MGRSETRLPGRGVYIFKLSLALLYAVGCGIAEKFAQDLSVSGMPLETVGLGITAVVVAPLAVCALIYFLWLSRADEYQRIIEVRAMAGAGWLGAGALIGYRLGTYFLPDATHVPTLGVVGAMLMIWIHTSRRLNVAALRP